MLLLEGELLEGGNQTRACVRDVIVAPGSQVDIEVVCVEQYRWSHDGPHGRRARRATITVQKAMWTDGHDRQGDVWDGVRRYETVTGPTGSGSLADHLDRVMTPILPRLLAGQNGVIVGVAGQPVALELFGSRAALQAHLSGIVDAAFLEAALGGPPQPVPARRARRFAARLEALDWQPEATEVGAAWAARTDRVSLRALTAGTGLAHVSAVMA